MYSRIGGKNEKEYPLNKNILLIALSVFPFLWAGTSATALNQQGYTQTRYPIVLVHGLFGFDSLAGVEYFYGIPQSLTRDGSKVYVAQVSAANSTERRGEQAAVALTKGFVALIDLLSGGEPHPQDPLASLAALTTEGSLKFNQYYPEGVPTSKCGEGAYQVNGVRCYSWSGGSTVTNL